MSLLTDLQSEKLGKLKKVYPLSSAEKKSTTFIELMPKVTDNKIIAMMDSCGEADGSLSLLEVEMAEIIKQHGKID